MNRHLLVPACSLAVLLAACSTPTPRPVAPTTPAPVSEPASPAPVVNHEVVSATAEPVAQTQTTWQRLRSGFVMDDCAVPASLRRARRETRNRKRFEKRMQQLLPMIDYIQQVASEHSVAGEFALLPWVESHFRQVAPRHRRPAGMWQIMPITARGLHLDMNRDYDGRLDTVASTRVVMAMLSAYYRIWHDWRLADMAYNTGEYRLRRILKSHGRPPATPVVPELPVGRTTRNHLTRLLAIACVIRDPARFHVRLPTLDPARRLQAVRLPSAVRLRRVAKLTGLSDTRLRELNAGYRRGVVRSDSPMQLLLPQAAAQRLRVAIADGRLQGDVKSLASAGKATTYTVASGDSLWSIAQRFHLQIGQLRQWNNLDGSVLHPGQTLQLEPPPSS